MKYKPEELSQQKCEHEHGNLVDNGEGFLICQDCSFALDKHFDTDLLEIKYEYDKIELKIDHLEKCLKNTCNNMNICNSILSKTICNLKQILKIRNENNMKINSKVEILLCALAMYRSCISENADRTQFEICAHLNIPLKKFLQTEEMQNNLEKKFGKYRDVTISNINLLRRFACELGFSRRKANEISNMTIVYNQLRGCHRPETLAALTIIVFCRKNKITIDKTNVCRICNVSISNITKILRQFYSIK